MDFNVSLRRAIKTGDVILGQNQTEQCINEGKAQMVVLAGNCPETFKNLLSSREGLFIYTTRDQASSLARRAENRLWSVHLL